MILDKLREYEFYSGDRKNKSKVSVTEICNGEVLPMVLARTTDKRTPKKLGQHTLGNIFDIGMRVWAKENGYESGERMEVTLPNGVTLTGEPDLLDIENRIIYDVKLSKIYAETKCKEEGAKHQYQKQLNYYRWMLSGEWQMKLLWGLKDQSDVNHKHPDEAMLVQNVVYIQNDWLCDNAVTLSNQMLNIIEGKEDMPEKCSDTWGNNMRCKSYCDVAPSCPYGKKFHGVNSW